LMTDQYPPFRLDQGGPEPERGQPTTTSTESSAEYQLVPEGATV